MRTLPTTTSPATPPQALGLASPAAPEPTAATAQKSRFYTQSAADVPRACSLDLPRPVQRNKIGHPQSVPAAGTPYRAMTEQPAALPSESGAPGRRGVCSSQDGQPSSVKPRRIAPTPVSKEEALEASPLEAQLLGRQDELEAYWQHYISVKEELVEQVLQVCILQCLTNNC